MDTQNEQDQIVTMEIPADPPAETLKTLQPEALETPIVTQIRCSCGNISHTEEENKNHYSDGTHERLLASLESKPRVGRPCEFCQDSANKLKITEEYLANATSELRPKMVYINELALKLDCDRDTIKEWADRKRDNSLEHPEFARMIKRLESIQELRLQQRVMGRYNPTGAIFLLKTKHNYMESEKRVLAGDANEPLQIEIIEEKKYVAED